MTCTEKAHVKVVVTEKEETGEDKSLIVKSDVDVSNQSHDTGGLVRPSAEETSIQEWELKAKELPVVGYSARDPVDLPSVSRWRYMTTFFVVLLTYSSPVLIVGVTVKIVDLKNTIEHPEGWLNCALWFAFVWSPFAQGFVWYIMLRVINKNRGYENWRPPVWKFPLHCAGVGGLILAVWALLKFAAGGLIPLHKCFSCATPTFMGIFNVWFWMPWDLLKLKAKEIVIAGAVPMVMLQCTSYLYICISIFLLQVENVGVLMLFPVTRHCCNIMYKKVTKMSDTKDILPIMIMANSYFERLHAMNALSMTDINPFYIAFTLDWAFTLRSFLIIVTPYRYKAAPLREKLGILFRMLKGSVDTEKPEDVRGRAGHTYFYVSECITEILTPFTLVLYYHVISNFKLTQGIAGFDDSGALGRGEIDGAKLLKAAVVSSGIDAVIFGVTLFLVRRHFSKFNPVATLSTYIEALGGLYIVLSIFPFLLMVGYDFIGTNTNYKFKMQ